MICRRSPSSNHIHFVDQLRQLAKPEISRGITRMELQTIKHLPIAVQEAIEKKDGTNSAETQAMRKKKDSLRIATSTFRRPPCKQHVKTNGRLNGEPCDAARS